MGAVWELVGFVVRLLSTKHQDNVNLYAVQMVFIILAPAWLAAFDYMLLGRLLRTLVPEARALGISARWIARIFVICDVFSFFVQLIGGASLSGAQTNASKAKTGEDIIEAGLIVQLVTFGFFTLIAIRFHWKMRQMNATHGTQGDPNQNWATLIYVLYVTCFLILLRNSYRVAEYVEGTHGNLDVHEVYFYMLDALPMLTSFILFNVFHPLRLFKTGFLGKNASRADAELTTLSA
ncbi:hypothetical protein MMC20_005837 [Loxospora ochrophaea]|nr:hypothetical protein [Loxospora ochrophaea]